MEIRTQSPAAGNVTAAAHRTQLSWAATPIANRLKTLRSIRHQLAQSASALADALSPTLSRTRADTYAAEILPLLAACKFLEQQATHLLASRRLGRRGLPFWLSGIDVTVERAPLGTILLISPSNYPLFLPGVQALQALAAGNAVVWKPGRNGLAIAQLFADLCTLAGLPSGLLRITDEAIETVAIEIQQRPDKIIFTGSADAGRAVQHLAAELSIPVIAELSGCDAVFVLASANPAAVIDALCFGMRLNGSATCMAPRRLILIGSGHEPMLQTLEERFAAMDEIFLDLPLRDRLDFLLADAVNQGAILSSHPGDLSTTPILVRNGTPGMKIAQADVFAPVLTVLSSTDIGAAIALEAGSPFGLAAAIFGDESEARELATHVKVGTVLINDLIVSTADPRIPFGGRKASGFGSTRGAEGLLEMTAPKTVSARQGSMRDASSRRHFQPTSDAHESLFAGVAALGHQRGWLARLQGLKKMVRAVANLK